MSFESPGYNLAALDGQPTERFEAVARATKQIDGLSEHLPLECPQAEVGVVYHPESQEMFDYNDEDDRFLADVRGTYRALWTQGITPDVISPRMDWSGYRQLFLPNVALMDEATRENVRRTLADSEGAATGGRRQLRDVLGGRAVELRAAGRAGRGIGRAGGGRVGGHGV